MSFTNLSPFTVIISYAQGQRIGKALIQEDVEAMVEALSNKAEAVWLSGLRATSDMEIEATALTVLNAAAALGRAGEYEPARLLCAEVILQTQPLIAARPVLFRTTMYALLVAHAFRLMSHVVSAVSGRWVDVTLLPDGAEPIQALRHHDKPRCTALLVNPRWLDMLSPDDVFLHRWCNGLTCGQPAAWLSVTLSVSLCLKST